MADRNRNERGNETERDILAHLNIVSSVGRHSTGAQQRLRCIKINR